MVEIKWHKNINSIDSDSLISALVISFKLRPHESHEGLLDQPWGYYWCI